MAGLRFCLLVAFLVIFIGWGFQTDAKPIDKPEETGEKEATEATEVAKEEDDGDADDDADASDRSKVQTHKKDANDCKREFHVQGACHPFHDHPEFGGNDDYDDDDASVRADRPEEKASSHKDAPSPEDDYSSIKDELKDKDVDLNDEVDAEKDILKGEETPDVEANKAVSDGPDVHTEGDQREINGGNYNHHSSSCPCVHDLICNTGHHGGCGHGLGHSPGIGGHGILGYGGHGCGCTQGALGPVGVCVPPGTCGAGNLGTYVCNNTLCNCDPKFGCSHMCGNVAMVLPHPECQSCSTQDKNQVEREKCYHPSCNLVNINGNVGLSLPHPCIQLDANQTCNTHMLTSGGHCGSYHGNCGCGQSNCGHGSSCCGCGNGLTHHSACTNCCFGRDDIHTVIASGDGPADDDSTDQSADAQINSVRSDAANTSNPNATNALDASAEVNSNEKEGDKSPTKRSDIVKEHAVTKCHVLGGLTEHPEPLRLCCHQGNEIQIANHCPNTGSCCQGGHITNVLPHPASQLDYQRAIYDMDCGGCGCDHVHNPLPIHDTCHHHCCGHHCCHHCGHHGHHCCHHCGHHGHHCCHHCGHHGHHCCHHCGHCCHHGDDCCHHDCCHEDECCDCCGHHKRTVVPLAEKSALHDNSIIQKIEGNMFV